MVFCSRSLLVPICESKLGCSGLLKHRVRTKGVATNNFSQKSFFIDFGLHLCRFLEALGAAFLIVAALETGLNIDGFSRGPVPKLLGWAS